MWRGQGVDVLQEGVEEVIVITEEELRAAIESEKNQVILGAYHALRSYQFGNSSEELAKEAADALEKYLPKEFSE